MAKMEKRTQVPFHDCSPFLEVKVSGTMTVEDFSESICHSRGVKPYKTIEDHISRAASIPEWCPEVDPMKEYENYPEERMWIPATNKDDNEWSPFFILLARSALTYAQESRGIPNREAMENSCSGYAEQHISNVFHDSGYVPEVTLWRLLTMNVPSQLIERWSSVDIALFEKGLQTYGKRFVSIKSDFLPHKTTMELVEFYYTWKRNKIVKGFGNSRFRRLMRRSRGRSFIGSNGVISERMVTRSRRVVRDQTDESPENLQIDEAKRTKRKR